MPVIRMENVGSLSDQQKKELIEKFTQVVVDVTKKSKETVYVKIEEIAPENFGVAGRPLG